MSSSELIDEDCIEESPEQLYPDIHVNYILLGDPEILPRVGDEYQVKIPPLLPVSDYIRLTNQTPTGIKTGDRIPPNELVMGPPMSAMRVKEEVQEIKHELPEILGATKVVCYGTGSTEFGKRKDLRESSGCKTEPDLVIVKSESLGIKLESLDTTFDDKTRIGGSSGLGKPWSDTEEAVFLLSVYIFRKNFDQMKRFIECMKMEHILSYYYGSFYGSIKYHKWKKKCKRRMYGAKIFTGLRQKELLSRLLPPRSEDDQNNILEVSKTFGEGNISLDEYVFFLKSMVGMNSLIEAVGLGKKKQDLTRVTRESLRSSQGFPVRAEIPTGKACATLTAENIIKFLTGDFRLSKAKSSDLFWEAVWPRLLARGWHSEQPKDRSYSAGSKHSLVFLMPDVTKFSRRKLVKGDHYFDSVTDVLSKVASEPELLELEIEEDQVNELSNDGKLDRGDLSDQHRHHYLQPKITRRSEDLVKITVIDTSMAHGEKATVREMKSFNVEMLNSSPTKAHMRKINSDSSEEVVEESDRAKTASCFNIEESSLTNHTSSAKDFLVDSSSTISPEKICNDQNSNMCNNTQPRKSTKWPSSRSDGSTYLAPIFKRRRRLSACSREEMNNGLNGFSSNPRLKLQVSPKDSNSPDHGERILSPEKQCEEKLLSTISWPKSDPIENNESSTVSECHAAEQPHEKSQPRMLFDLNVVVPPEPESDNPFTTQMTDEEEKSHNTIDIPAHVASSEQNTDMTPRRQGTRNRPLTTKALEALANGYLSIKQRRRQGANSSHENLVPRPHRRARFKTDSTKNIETSLDESKLEIQNSEVCASSNSNDTVFSEFQVQSEVK